MEQCPITGMPCSNPKVIHVTDIGKDYTAENAYDLCQICGLNKLQQQLPQGQPQEQTPPVIKNLFDLLKLIITSKKQEVQGPTPPEPLIPLGPTQNKPPCPGCGATWHEIDTKSRLGCPQCYEHYKTELLPVLIHAHKSAEHVGKHPKPKPAVLEDFPVEEQIRILEMQIKQAAEFEQYEKAMELKKKLTELKSANPPPEPDAS